MSDSASKPAGRPLPSLAVHDTQPFWEATADQRLTYQQCEACGEVVFYPRAHCAGCTEDQLVWREASGRGTVYSYSVVRQSYHPFFRNLVPYAIAWIDLEEGPRLLANITGVADPVNDIQIGMPVEVEWEVHDELSIPLFKPVSA